MQDTSVIDKTETQAFYNKLFKTYYAYIYAVVGNSIPNKSDIDDIVNETFFACWQSINKLKEHTDPRRWLIATARNKTKHYQRGLHKQKKILDAVKPDDNNPSSYNDSSFEHLSLLRQDDREILLMHYEQGLKNSEIAQIYNIKETAVKMRMSRARVRLGEILAGSNLIKIFRPMCYL